MAFADFISSCGTLCPVALLGVFLTFMILYDCYNKRALPPGPPALPLLGNYLSLPTSKSWLLFTSWSKKYVSTKTPVPHVYMKTSTNSAIGRDLHLLQWPHPACHHLRSTCGLQVIDRSKQQLQFSTTIYCLRNIHSRLEHHHSAIWTSLERETKSVPSIPQPFSDPALQEKTGSRGFSTHISDFSRRRQAMETSD